MLQNLRLGLVQMTSASTHAPNIKTMEARIAEAAAAGCELVAFPEVAGALTKHPESLETAQDAEADPFISAACRAAKAHGVWIHTGSTPLRGSGDKFLNHSNLIDDNGRIVSAYNKIHLFDFHPENAPPMLESRRYEAGTQGVLAQSPWGLIGMSVCYDLRFANLYRRYAQAGAKIMMIPSAFTVPTGKAHWEVLLRARAIETGAFVVAAAQVGSHETGRETYGHSLVVGPWGKIEHDMGANCGLAVIDLDLSAVDRARVALPSLSHDREYTI